MRTAPFLRLGVLTIAVTLTGACRGSDTAAVDDASPGGAPAGQAAGASSAWATDLQPDAGGQVHTVQMITDGAGNRFEPADLTVKRGDVIRYTLQTGVHNVHFVADSNPTRNGIPATPSDYLQLPGQAIDAKVTAAPGSYFYQCDPHAALGMVGRVTVQ